MGRLITVESEVFPPGSQTFPRGSMTVVLPVSSPCAGRADGPCSLHLDMEERERSQTHPDTTHWRGSRPGIYDAKSWAQWSNSRWCKWPSQMMRPEGQFAYPYCCSVSVTRRLENKGVQAAVCNLVLIVFCVSAFLDQSTLISCCI